MLVDYIYYGIFILEYMRSFYRLHIVTPPERPSDFGEYASIAFTNQFFYICDGKQWRRTAFDRPPLIYLPWTFPTKKLDNLVTIDNEYFYIYFNGSWKSFGINSIDSRIVNKNDTTYSPKLIEDFPLQIIGSRKAGQDVINASSYGREGSLAFDTNYFYCFIGGSWKKRGISDFSNVVLIETINPIPPQPTPIPPAPLIPSPPTNFNVISGSAILTWTNDPLSDYCSIEKSVDGNSYYQIGTSLSEIYVDTDVVSSIQGNSYWYRGAAVNSTGTSSYSEVTTITFYTALQLTLTASFIVDTASAVPPFTASFTDTTTYTGTNPLTYLFDFGDGSPTTASANVKHIYSNYGSAVASLQVTSSIDNLSSSYSMSIYGLLPSVDGHLVADSDWALPYDYDVTNPTTPNINNTAYVWAAAVNCHNLTYLNCNSNQLTSLNLSGSTALTYLYCNSNQLTSLDVSTNIILNDFSCEFNHLTSLDVSTNNALVYLYCDYNQLTTLDVLTNVVLAEVGCGNNQLTSLDISTNTILTWLYCNNNQLTFLGYIN